MKNILLSEMIEKYLQFQIGAGKENKYMIYETELEKIKAIEKEIKELKKENEKLRSKYPQS